MTKIPFFREVIVSSFTCDHCGHRNSELQPAGRIQEKGIRYTVKIRKAEDLNRQVVQTQYASIAIPEVELESPPSKGCLTTIEGIIDRVVEGLNQQQILRRIQHPELAAQIDMFIEKLEGLKKLEKEFTVVIDDPSGNSFIENLQAPRADPQLTLTHYKRTDLQQESLGLMPELDENEKSKFSAKDEVLSFAGNCSVCNAPAQTNMKLVDIPHFKEVVIMSTNCDTCGMKDSEVKGGSGIEPLGKRITLHITDPSDLSRDILKGDMASVMIPELDFNHSMSTASGRFTTLEGLLVDVMDQLKRFNPFLEGDSSLAGRKNKVEEFCTELEKIRDGERLDVHIVIDDPTGNSYIQNLYAPDPDPELKIETYKRTTEQDDDLGVSDMKTENYSQLDS